MNPLYQEQFNYFDRNKDHNGHAYLSLCHCYYYGVFSPVSKLKARQLLAKRNHTVAYCESKNRWLMNLLVSKPDPIKNNVAGYAQAFGESALFGRDGFDKSPVLADRWLCRAV